MRWRQGLHVKPDTAPLGRFAFEVRQKGTTDALAMKVGPDCHEVNFKRVREMLGESGCPEDLGPVAGKPRRQPPEVAKICCVRLRQAEPLRERCDQRLALIGEARCERNQPAI